MLVGNALFKGFGGFKGGFKGGCDDDWGGGDWGGGDW